MRACVGGWVAIMGGDGWQQCARLRGRTLPLVLLALCPAQQARVYIPLSLHNLSSTHTQGTVRKLSKLGLEAVKEVQKLARNKVGSKGGTEWGLGAGVGGTASGTCGVALHGTVCEEVTRSSSIVEQVQMALLAGCDPHAMSDGRT